MGCVELVWVVRVWSWCGCEGVKLVWVVSVWSWCGL